MAERGRAPTAWLEVSRKELLQALRTLHKFAARRGAAAVDEAEKKRYALLERATKLLRPLEIPQDVLRSLVDAWVRRGFEEEE